VRIERGDARAQDIGAVGLAVADAEPVDRRVREREQLADGERVNAAFRQVVLDAVLVERLPALHDEWLE